MTYEAENLGYRQSDGSLTEFPMTDQEKKEVMAKWAGLTKINYINQAVDEYTVFEFPDLLHSLDAQAKWLDPKLNEVLADRGWTICVTPWKDPVYEVWLGARLDISSEDNDLAVAKAEAILVLIEGEK